MDDHLLELRVLYTDLPDLVEVGVRVRHGDWSAASTAYTSPSFLAEGAESILRWTRSPDEPLRLEAGADTGLGWLVLVFSTVDRAGHVRCAVTLATGGHPIAARPAETWRLAIELPTELGLAERFARECIAMGSDFKGKARLIGLSE